MKFYGKMVVGCAIVMLVAGIAIQALPWGLSGLAATLVAGYLGVKLSPKVPVLRERHPWKVAAFLVVAGLLQGAGGFWKLPVLWGLGLFGSFVLPLASLAFDALRDEERRQEMLRDLHS